VPESNELRLSGVSNGPKPRARADGGSPATVITALTGPRLHNVTPTTLVRRESAHVNGPAENEG